MLKQKKDTVLSLLLEIRDCLKGTTIAIEKTFIPKSNGRFTTLKDGWVKDNLLGLDWGPSSDKRMTWEEAKKYCAEKGERLPEIEELSRLVDYKKHTPCIDKDFFPDTKTDDYYWTGTTVAWGSSDAWMVGFYGGNVYGYNEDSNGYVRPVRLSQ